MAKTLEDMTVEKARQMLKLQQQLNDATNGEGWEAGRTKNGKMIDWKRCIYMECAEMIDSFAWKHWKNIAADPDWANLQIEVIDVWHFVMSLVLQEYKRRDLGSLDDAASAIAVMPFYEMLLEDAEGFAEEKLVMAQVESVMKDALDSRVDLTKLLADFFELVRMSNLDAVSLYRLYVGKNILNQFRQDHGYKEGHYVKLWNGEEDNVVMKRLWEEKGEMTPDELYAGLEAAYPAS
jgi:dimeric dUTPase (all-alpha-NTP-PPase superfamily)